MASTTNRNPKSNFAGPSMPSKRKKSGHAADAGDRDDRGTQAGSPLPPAAALSFLKETRGTASWSAQDLAKSLNVSIATVRQVIPFLQAQGYIEASGSAGWLTTVAGDTVAGSKPPRFTPEVVETALSALAGRIKAANQDASARFRVTKAVAFGDFLADRARVQAADVGVQLSLRGPASAEAGSAVEKAAEREFLRQLRGKYPILSIRPYEDWMSSRSHRKLL
jgi:DNA-binding transcriptional regulator YhcF (GntR family)